MKGSLLLSVAVFGDILRRGLTPTDVLEDITSHKTAVLLSLSRFLYSEGILLALLELLFLQR